MLYTYSVTPLAEDALEERAADIVTQVKRGVFQMPLFSMTLVPEGDPVWNKAGQMVQIYARYRDRLAKDGVEAGILCQASLGHGYPIAKNPFQRYINLSDGKDVDVCCPLDDNFIRHFSDVMRTLAKERPRAIMLDDDFRMMMRPGRACTCPLHMAEFNRRAGTNMTREELAEHIRTHGRTDPLKRIFEQTQVDSLVRAAAAFRAAIDEIDPTIQGIICTSGHICESAIYTSKAFAGHGNPTIVRVGNGSYAPFSIREFSLTMTKAAICRSKLKRHGIDHVLAETDTIPFNRYAKSARHLHAHFTASILEGCTGAKHWLTRLSAYEPASGVAYRDILAKHHLMYERLADIAAKGIRWFGACSFFIEQEEVDFHGEKYSRFHDHFWIEKVMERMGIPFYYAEGTVPAAFLEGKLAAVMSDEQIRQVFEGSVFMDGAAAAVLTARGYGALLGVSVSDWDLGKVSGETLDGTAHMLCTKQKDLRKITVIDPHTEVLSHNYLKVDDGIQLLSPAVTVLERSEGRLSVVYCGSPNAPFTYMEGFAFLNESRKAQFVSLLSRAGALPLYCVGDEEICLRAGYLPDGGILAAVYQLGIDPTEDLTLYLEKEPSSITMIMPNGSETPVAFTALGNSRYTLHTRVEMLYPLVLMIQ